MRTKMDSSLMLIFVLSFVSVTTEEQKEVVNTPLPDAQPAFKRIERVDGGSEEEKNDAEIFWEVTKTPNNGIPSVVVDGNYPDNYDITTHDHVDQAMGHVPPTKRVKKILQPFDTGKQRTARHIGTPPLDGLKASSMIKGEILTSQGGREPSKTYVGPENVTETLTMPTLEDEIEGIRLVPNEFEAEGRKAHVEGEEGEDEGEEEETMQKSIWDLLKEREKLNSTHFDAPENPFNETEGTRRGTSEVSKSLYDHFDADSAEVEFETENFNRGSNIQKHELPISYAMAWLQVQDRQFDPKGKTERGSSASDIPQDVSKLLKLSQNEKSMNGVSVLSTGGGEYGRRPSKWYLLLLTGNSTIVKLRRKDFTKYLKLNLAARLSMEYDDVKVNKVILAPPKVLVNISVFAPSDDVAEESQLDYKLNEKGEAPLYKLAETNATLLELSGEEYHVIRFLSFETQKPEAEAHKDVPRTVPVASRQNDAEFIMYTFLGSACACAALLTFFLTISRYYKKVSDLAWFKPKPSAWRADEDGESGKDEFNGVSPAVIYSGGFPQIRGSWMTGAGDSVSHIRQQHPGICAPPPSKSPTLVDLDERPCSSPRHSKLRIYNCHAESLVIPIPRGRTDTHPLDVRISGEKTGQDNPIFTN